MEELHDIIAVGAGTSSKIVHQEDHQVDRIEKGEWVALCLKNEA